MFADVIEFALKYRYMCVSLFVEWSEYTEQTQT